MICPICPHRCDLSDGQTGFCRARTNVQGVISANNYGRITAICLDPIEKKPFARFHPGKMILSVGSYGCNLACPFCQNAEISMAGCDAQTAFVSPEALVQRALELVPRGNIGLAFTYNEPLVGYEFVSDTAKLLKKAGLAAVLVTNGYIEEAPLEALLPYIDALNIDLKGFSEDYYRFLGGSLAPVLRTIKHAAARCHVEITTLAVPGKNDSDAEMERLSDFLASINPDLPLHISRFFPRYRMKALEPTPVSTVLRLCKVASRNLRHVYPGNCF